MVGKRLDNLPVIDSENLMEFNLKVMTSVKAINAIKSIFGKCPIHFFALCIKLSWIYFCVFKMVCFAEVFQHNYPVPILSLILLGTVLHWLGTYIIIFIIGIIYIYISGFFKSDLKRTEFMCNLEPIRKAVLCKMKLCLSYI